MCGVGDPESGPRVQPSSSACWPFKGLTCHWETSLLWHLMRIGFSAKPVALSFDRFINIDVEATYKRPHCLPFAFFCTEMFSVIWVVLFDNGRMPILYLGVFLFSVREFGVCVWCVLTATGAVGTICLPIEARGCFTILCPIPRREGLSLNLELCWHRGNPSDALVSAPHMTEVIGVGSHTELINEGARELNPSHDCIAGALTRWTPCLSLRIYLLCFICVRCVCLHRNVCAYWSQKSASGPHGARVTQGCELFSMGRWQPNLCPLEEQQVL